MLATQAGHGALLGGCPLLVSPASVFMNLSATTNDSGVARYPLPLRGIDTFDGMRIFGQAIVLDARAAKTQSSHGLQLILGS